jgi:hypothetical protein
MLSIFTHPCFISFSTSLLMEGNNFITINICQTIVLCYCESTFIGCHQCSWFLQNAEHANHYTIEVVVNLIYCEIIITCGVLIFR